MKRQDELGYGTKYEGYTPFITFAEEILDDVEQDIAAISDTMPEKELREVLGDVLWTYRNEGKDGLDALIRSLERETAVRIAMGEFDDPGKDMEIVDEDVRIDEDFDAYIL